MTATTYPRRIPTAADVAAARADARYERRLHSFTAFAKTRSDAELRDDAARNGRVASHDWAVGPTFEFRLTEYVARIDATDAEMRRRGIGPA